jgi:Tfp pilus assembly protein PilW
MPATTRPSGFSLVELLVALGASVLVMLGATFLLRFNYHAFQSSSAERVLQENGRIALSAISGDLRQAGLGVDPGLVFDFGRQPNARAAAGPVGASFATTPLACPTAVTCRDSVAGPDELVFLSRDPAFGKVLTVAVNASSGSLTVRGPLNEPLHRGQILLVACYSGSMTMAYVQLTGSVAASAGTGAVTLPIAAVNPAVFPTQNGVLADGCFSTVADTTSAVTFAATTAAAAKVFKVDRFRYFIRSFDAAGAVVAWGTAGSRPWLMLDRGTIDATTAANRPQIEPVAPDVEDLQLAYVFPLDTASPVAGATGGTALINGATGIDLTAACPASSDDPTGPNRLTHHPGNIRAVQVALVLRSAEPDLTLASSSTLPAALNRPALTSSTGHQRLLLQTTVPVRNLDARAPYFPYFGTGTDQLNVGGG